MSARIFAARVIENEVRAAGVLEDLQIPAPNKFRIIWCFYESANMLTTGAECWINFYLRGELVAALPASVVLSVASHIGIAHLGGVPNPLVQTNSGSTMYWNNSDAAGWYHVQPFKFNVEADLVRIEHNVSGATTMLLAVLSTESAS